MDCSKCRESLHSYVSDALDTGGSTAVRRHLESCSKCSMEFTEILRLRELGRAAAGAIRLPQELKDSIMASIDLERYKPAKKKNSNELVKWGMSLVAAGLVMLLLNSVPASYTHTFMPVRHGKIIQTVDSFSRGFDRMSEELIQLDGITERLGKQYKGGI